MLIVAVAWSSSDNNAIHYVLPVLWMTSRFHITGHVAHGTGSIDMGAVVMQILKISYVFARGATLFEFVVVYNGNKFRTGAKPDVYDCLVLTLIISFI